MPPSIAMEGYLEKRIQRPFGIVVWQKRHVMLTPSEIVVRNPMQMHTQMSPGLAAPGETPRGPMDGGW